MIQFLIGTSNLNVSWLGAFLGGRFYNAPPLFFVGMLILLGTGFYSFKLRPEMLRFVAIIGALGTAAGLLHGFDSWHLRQSIAFLAAAVIWIFVYQEGWRRDIYTLERTKVLLVVYFVYVVLVKIESVMGTAIVPYAISCVFSYTCGGNVDYLAAGRLSFFSEEPSAAALAIVASLMPFLCANAVVNRTWKAFGLAMLGLFVLHYAEGMTAQALMVFSFGFILWPRLAVLAVPVSMMLIAGIAVGVSHVLGEPGGVQYLVQNWLGGIYSRVDAGIESGSYVGRAMNWLIGARAFISAPLTGLGIGGTQSYFFTLDNAGYYIVLGAEQEDMVAGATSPTNSPMVVRILAELGLIGTFFLTYYCWRAFRLALEPNSGDDMLQYAFLYSLGAMLLSFCFAGELLNPCITAFVALLAQRMRLRDAAKVSPSSAPNPEYWSQAAATLASH